MKGYGTDYKPLGKNNSVAYFDKTIDSLMAGENKVGSPLPQKIQYTLPKDNLEVYAPIDGEVQYIKLELEDSNNTILYFYRNDMSEVLAVNKQNDLYMTGTFTMDYYYTYFLDMANILEDVNPDVYFLRRFAGRFDEADFVCNLHERGGFKNALPIEITPDYKTNIDVTNQTLMDINDVESVKSQGFYSLDTTGVEFNSVQAGQVVKRISFSNDFNCNYNLNQYENHGKSLLSSTAVDSTRITVDNTFGLSGGVLVGSLSGQIRIAGADVEGHTIFANSSSISGLGTGDKDTLTFTFDENGTVNSISSMGGKGYKGNMKIYTSPMALTYAYTNFNDQSIGNKYRYAVVSKSAFSESSAASSFAMHGVDLVLVPIPIKDLVVTYETGDVSSYNISIYNTVLYNNTSSASITFNGNEDTIMTCFEAPISFELFSLQDAQGNTNTNYVEVSDGKHTIPIFFYPLTSIYRDSYLDLKLSSIPSFSSYLDGTEYNEPYLLYNNQFRRLDIGLEEGIEFPFYDLEGKYNTDQTLSIYLLVNNDMRIGLNPESFADGSAKYQDRYEFQAKISNNIIKETSAYNNGLATNIATEQTARANLQDQKTMMQRQQAMNGLGVGSQLASDITGGLAGGYDTSKYVPYGKGAGKKALRKVPGVSGGDIAGDVVSAGFGAAETVLQNQNLSTEFGIKQRNLNTMFSNIRKSPASITNQDCDKEMIPFITDGLRVILGELTPSQKNIVMQEIYNYGYAYDGVAPFREYNNRGLYNVIQINTDYNRETLEQIIKTNYKGIGNFQTAIDIFLDWMGSIHRIYKTDNFDVDKTKNIEIKIQQPTYQIIPETFEDPSNLVNGTAEMQLPDGQIYTKTGSLKLIADVVSMYVDFSDLPGGEYHEFTVDGKFTPVTTTYTIDPVDYNGNSVNGTATMTTSEGNQYDKKGTYSYDQDVSSFTVDFSDIMYGENHTFEVNGKYVPTSTIIDQTGGRIYNVQNGTNDRFTSGNDNNGHAKDDSGVDINLNDSTKTYAFKLYPNKEIPEGTNALLSDTDGSGSPTKYGASFGLDMSYIPNISTIKTLGINCFSNAIGTTTAMTTLVGGDFSLFSSLSSVGQYFLNSAFAGCSNLKTLSTDKPINLTLPALEIATNEVMQTIFDGCRSLTKGTDINLPSLSSVGDRLMFCTYRDCSSMSSTGSVNLSALQVCGNDCLNSMYQRCYSFLEDAGFDLPNLTTINGYDFMRSTYYQCSSLTSVSNINLSSVTTAGDGMFRDCFNGCHLLTKAPKIDLSNLSSVGNNFMGACFNGCSSLVVSTYERPGAVLLQAPNLSIVGSSEFMVDCFKNCILLDVSSTPTLAQLKAGIGIGGVTVEYSIDPVDYNIPGNSVKGTATMKVTPGETYTKSGTQTLTETITSFSVDFSEYEYGENHTFAVDGEYRTPPPPKELTDVTSGDYITSMVLTDFVPTTTSDTEHRLYFKGPGSDGYAGEFIIVKVAYVSHGIVRMYSPSPSAELVIFETDDGGGQPSKTVGDVTGDLDTKTITFSEPLNVTANGIVSGDYTGNVTCNLA